MDRRCVLLVDDDQDFVLATSGVLRRAGYAVCVATDAVSAVSVAVHERPQAVLLDVGLPGGDGTMVMRRLHALPHLAGAPVLVISGRDPDKYRDAALKAGATAYLVKPVEPQELLAALSAAMDDEDPAESVADEHAHDLDGRLVLLVDDDADLLYALAAALRHRRLEVVVAADAVSAVAVAVKQHPDAVVLDVGLPGGDGPTVANRMRAMPQLTGMPVVMISGRDPEKSRDAALAAGASAFLTKPVDADDLLAALRTALELA